MKPQLWHFWYQDLVLDPRENPATLLTSVNVNRKNKSTQSSFGPGGCPFSPSPPPTPLTLDSATMSASSETKVRREEVLELMDQKKKVEDELAELYGVLSSQGVTMEEPLVDGQGYPRNDVDVYQVRHARSRINRLRNDLGSLMDRIENGIHSLHAQNREEGRAGERQEEEEEDEQVGAGPGAGPGQAGEPTPECFAKYVRSTSTYAVRPFTMQLRYCLTIAW